MTRQQYNAFASKTDLQFGIETFGHGRHWLTVKTHRGTAGFPMDRKRFSKPDFISSLPTEPPEELTQYMAAKEAIGINRGKAFQSYMRETLNWRRTTTLFYTDEIRELKQMNGGN